MEQLLNHYIYIYHIGIDWFNQIDSIILCVEKICSSIISWL